MVVRRVTYYFQSGYGSSPGHTHDFPSAVTKTQMGENDGDCTDHLMVEPKPPRVVSYDILEEIYLTLRTIWLEYLV